MEKGDSVRSVDGADDRRGTAPRPGLTKNGPFENCAQAVGKTYESVMGEIIESAMKRLTR